MTEKNIIVNRGIPMTPSSSGGGGGQSIVVRGSSKTSPVSGPNANRYNSFSPGAGAGHYGDDHHAGDNSFAYFNEWESRDLQIRAAYDQRLNGLASATETELASVRAQNDMTPLPPAASLTRELAIRDRLIAVKTAESIEQDKIANSFYGSDPLTKTQLDWVNLYNSGHDGTTILQRWTTSYSAAYTAKLIREQIKILNAQSAGLRQSLQAAQAVEAKAAADKAAADRLAAQQAAAAKAAADQLAAQQAAAAKAAADRLAAQQAAAAKAAADKAAADRLAAQQAAAAKAAADQLAAQQAAAAYRLAAQQADKAFADKLAAQQATAAKAAAIKAAADKVAADKLAVERAAASKAYFEKIAAHKLALQAAADRKAAEAKAAADKLAALKAIADKIEATRAKNTFKISSVTKTTQVSAVAGSIALTANTTLTLDTAVKSAIQMLNSLKSAATLETTAGLLARYIPFSLLVWSPKLGNSDLYPSNQPQVLFTAPVSEIFPELNHSDLLTKGYNWKTATVPYRIHGNPTGFSLIETGKNLKVDPHVKVFVIVTNKKLNAHKIMTGDIPPQTMFFPMETPANSSTETPAQLVNPIVYDGVTLTPIEVKAETLPAVDQLTFRDCIYCFPADTGLPPIYVVFSEPADNLIIDSKIKVQIPERGWTEQDIISITSKEHAGESRDNRRASKTPDGNPRNDRALVYGSPGKYVIVNSRTREVIQISDVSGKPWIDDSRIKWSK